MQDIREVLFHKIENKRFRAHLIPERDGVLSGCEEAGRIAGELKIDLTLHLKEGGRLVKDEPFAELIATPLGMAMAEERIMGSLAKASGIATAAADAVAKAGEKLRVVAGAWKKMPPEMKESVRRAVVTGGAGFRMCEPPMVYLDKNYIAMFGSITAALDAARAFEGHTRIVQLRGDTHTIEEETAEAIRGGCDIFMVDTGREEDLESCVRTLEREGVRAGAGVAFAGDVRLIDIPGLIKKGADVLCIGKEIVDAPMVDMRMDVTGEAGDA